MGIDAKSIEEFIRLHPEVLYGGFGALSGAALGGPIGMVAGGLGGLSAGGVLQQHLKGVTPAVPVPSPTVAATLPSVDPLFNQLVKIKANALKQFQGAEKPPAPAEILSTTTTNLRHLQDQIAALKGKHVSPEVAAHMTRLVDVYSAHLQRAQEVAQKSPQLLLNPRNEEVFFYDLLDKQDYKDLNLSGTLSPEVQELLKTNPTALLRDGAALQPPAEGSFDVRYTPTINLSKLQPESPLLSSQVGPNDIQKKVYQDLMNKAMVAQFQDVLTERELAAAKQQVDTSKIPLAFPGASLRKQPRGGKITLPKNSNPLLWFNSEHDEDLKKFFPQGVPSADELRIQQHALREMYKQYVVKGKNYEKFLSLLKDKNSPRSQFTQGIYDRLRAQVDPTRIPVAAKGNILSTGGGQIATNRSLKTFPGLSNNVFGSVGGGLVHQGLDLTDRLPKYFGSGQKGDPLTKLDKYAPLNMFLDSLMLPVTGPIKALSSVSGMPKLHPITSPARFIRSGVAGLPGAAAFSTGITAGIRPFAGLKNLWTGQPYWSGTREAFKSTLHGLNPFGVARHPGAAGRNFLRGTPIKGNLSPISAALGTATTLGGMARRSQDISEQYTPLRNARERYNYMERFLGGK